MLNLQQELHIKDYIDVLRRRRETMILFFITTLLAVMAGTFIMKPVYRAAVTLLVDPESPNILTTTGMVEMQAQNYLSYKEYYQTQIEILTSRTLAKKVFGEFGLGSMPKYAKTKEPIKEFLKTVKVDPVRDTRLLKLYVDNYDPELAAGIANRIADLYVKRNIYYISKSELMNLFKNEYLKLEARLSEYTKVYKEGHPEMIKLKKEIAEMAARIDEEKRSVYNYDSIEKYLSDDSRHALSGFKANNIMIQDSAERPVVPIKPKKLLNAALAALFGLLGGIALAFFFEYLDDTAKTVDDIEKITNWPFLGNIPDIDRTNRLKELEKDVFVNLKPKDPISEIFRLTRTRVLFSSTEEHPLKTIMVTSPGSQEGKTTFLCNLGISMAQNRKSVLLVDADMRKPRLHDVFKKNNDSGLSNFLINQNPLNAVIQKTGIENLSFVSGGTTPPNPSELLASHKAREFIAKVKEDFDFILFDSPPSGMLTDAAIISSMVDGTIIVVQSGKTSKRVLPRINQIMENAKARIIGVIVNKAHANAANFQYYYSAYYGK